MFLSRLQELAPNMMLKHGHIDGIIDAGDELFECTAQKNEEANMKSLKKFVIRCLRLHDVEVKSDEEYEYEEEKEVSADDDSGSNADDESTESDEIPTAATFAAEAATATQHQWGGGYIMRWILLMLKCGSLSGGTWISWFEEFFSSF
jgi:hypothetical protein